MRTAIFAVASAIVAVAGPASAQPSIEAYGLLPDIISAEMSPDGDRIALLQQVGSSVEVRIYDIPTATYSHRFNAGDLKTHSLGFADNDHVLLSASQTARSDFLGRNNKYEFDGKIAVNLKNGRSIQLLSREDSIADGQRSLGRIVGQLDNGQLLIPALQEFKNGVRRVDLVRADPDSGRGFTHAAGDLNTLDWFVDRNGDPLVRERFDVETYAYTLDVWKDGRWKTFYESSDSAVPPLHTIGVTAADDGIYYVPDEEAGQLTGDVHILRFDGTTELANLAMDGVDIDAVRLDKNRHLLGVTYSGAFPDYGLLDSDLRANYRQVRSAFANSAIHLDSWSQDRSRVLYRVFDGQQVDFWVLNDAAAGKMTLLAPSRNAIPAASIGKVYAINYPARDGLDIPAIITLPPGQAFEVGMKLPMIVMPHGGPAAYDSVDFDWMAQFFASRGYMVVQPNFRGSTGYGRAHYLAGRGEWGRKMQDDLTDGVEAMVRDQLADPERVCIVGASYGGYAALAGGAFAPDLYACVAAIAPVTDLPDLLNEERLQAYDDQVLVYWRRSIGSTDRETLRSISPTEHADAFTAPVLLIHGKDDTVVPVDQSEKMARSLKNADKPVDFVRLNDGDHWLSTSEMRLATLKALAAFVDEHIGPATASAETAGSPSQ